ncbi:MAG: NAD(P)/FAD-dependent oxidoreductase [Gemmatimonadota bacterium]|jgi:flavin-dependent dehydrogenase
MSGAKWDAIVVGARCAGAATAAYLSRAGVRTLCIDRAKLPSDYVLSTHFVQPPGMDVLDELGVGDRVRDVTPPSFRPLSAMDDERLYSNYPDGRAAYCIRRSTLDPIVLDAAVESGATVRDQHTVVELVEDGERVTGVVLDTPSGRETVLADIVIGADGKESTVAKLTGVERYEHFVLDRGGYWGYFPTPAVWHDRERYDCDGIIAFEGDGLRYVFQCDGDLLLIAGVPPAAEARSWRGDHRAKLLDYLAASDLISPLVRETEPVGKLIGLMKYESFLRRPVGPGFALVGDAGAVMDFVTGQGIAQALLNAKTLAEAVVQGGERALERYHRQRDADIMPLFLDAKRLGTVGINSPVMRLIFREASKQGDLDSFAEIMDRRRSPFDFVPQKSLFYWMLQEMARLRFEAVGSFLEVGKTMSAHRKLCAEYAARADEVEQRCTDLPPWPLDAMGGLAGGPARADTAVSMEA